VGTDLGGFGNMEEKMSEINNQELAKVEEKKEKGASLVEYALLVALIAVVCIVAVTALGKTVSAKFSTINSGLQ